MRLNETKSYQTETPAFLWDPFTEVIADDYPRYKDRITVLIAEDVLEHCPERLSDRERELAQEIVEELSDV